METKTTLEFIKNHNLTIEQFYGIEKIGGGLDLRSLTSIPKGFNPTVGGYLDLDSLTSIPKGFNPTVGGYLNLRSLTSIPKGFNPTVGGGLYLDSLTSIPKGFNPTVGGYLNLDSLTSIPKGFNPTVGGGLYLDSLTSIPKGFNPTVGGYLNLRSLTSIPKGFNPTVGGYLYLDSLTSIPKGFNPTVGGGLYLDSLTSIAKPNYIKLNGNEILSWQDGKYISCDGIFSEVINKIGNVYKVKSLTTQKESYIITNGEFNSHGETLKKAKEDLDFKILSNKLKSEPITETTIINKQYYRIITGACEIGVDNFIKENNLTDESYMAKDLLPILEKNNAYGLSKFKELLSK